MYETFALSIARELDINPMHLSMSTIPPHTQDSSAIIFARGIIYFVAFSITRSASSVSVFLSSENPSIITYPSQIITTDLSFHSRATSIVIHFSQYPFGFVIIDNILSYSKSLQGV